MRSEDWLEKVTVSSSLRQIGSERSIRFRDRPERADSRNYLISFTLASNVKLDLDDFSFRALYYAVFSRSMEA